VALVEGVRDEFGLTPALAVLGLARSSWYYRTTTWRPYEAKHAALRSPLEGIARAHTEYGYRRTTTELGVRLGEVVNHKVVQRLHQCWDLPLVRRTKAPPPSAVRQVLVQLGERMNLVAQLETIRPLEVLYTDFTELVYADGKAWQMTLLDHASKVVIGWAVGDHADTELALETWSQGRRWLRRHGYRVAGRIVHSDRDPVYTGYGWTGTLLLRDRVRLSYALGGCKDNQEMESFHSRFKGENRSLFLEAPSVAALRAVVRSRVEYYNRRRRHSALGNQPPLTFLANRKGRR
jgi:putative transposase